MQTDFPCLASVRVYLAGTKFFKIPVYYFIYILADLSCTSEYVCVERKGWWDKEEKGELGKTVIPFLH